jgi:hypothetical protein
VTVAKKAKPRPKSKRKASARKGWDTRRKSAALAKPPPSWPVETAQVAVANISQDAVVILRRELAYRADLSMRQPGLVNMSDCIALLRLATELGAAAAKGQDGESQQADYSRLSPEERVQLAALLLKVDYV